MARAPMQEDEAAVELDAGDREEIERSLVSHTRSPRLISSAATRHALGTGPAETSVGVWHLGLLRVHRDCVAGSRYGGDRARSLAAGIPTRVGACHRLGVVDLFYLARGKVNP